MAVTIDDIKVAYVSAATLGDDTLTLALEVATMIVTEQLRPYCSMSEDRYDKITLYLSCHIVSISQSAQQGSVSGGGLRNDKLGDASQSFDSPSSNTFAYQSTRWGQLALALDTCGKLASTNKFLRAQFRVA